LQRVTSRAVSVVQPATEQSFADLLPGPLLGLRGRPTDAAKEQEVHYIYLKLLGWSWAEGTFSWVEPTAWACLALQRVGQGGHERVRECLQLLLDRALDEGGINYGNRRILGCILEPIPGPTALMLVALQKQPRSPRVLAAVNYLGQQALTGDDLRAAAAGSLVTKVVYLEDPQKAVPAAALPGGPAEGELPPGRGHAYLAGEVALVTALKATLLARGWSPDDISAKAYWNRGRANAGHGEPVIKA